MRLIARVIACRSARRFAVAGAAAVLLGGSVDLGVDAGPIGLVLAPALRDVSLVVEPGEVVALLGALGFAEVRQKGSHKQFRHADGRGTTVFSSERRNIPAMIRATCSGRPRWSVNGRATQSA